MEVDDKIRDKKLHMILTEEPKKYPHQVKLNSTNYCCTKIVKLNYKNHFFGNSNKTRTSTNSIQSFIRYCRFYKSLQTCIRYSFTFQKDSFERI